MDILDIVIVFLLGLVLGSFATALSYRLPRDISIVTQARSQCPACHHLLGFADLVPVFSWIFLRGKCRFCRAAIGFRYPVIEISTLLLCLLFYTVYGLTLETFLIFALAPVIISIVDIDLHYKIIPDSLNLAIILIGIGMLFMNAAVQGNALNFLIDKGSSALAGTIVYGLGALLLRQVAMEFMKREPMGLGDVKFFAAAGFWLGLHPSAAAAFMVLSGVSGIVLAVLWKKRTGEAEFPFGPSLVIAFTALLCLYPAEFSGV